MPKLVIVNPGKKKGRPKKKKSGKKSRTRTVKETKVVYRNKAQKKKKRRSYRRNPGGTFMGVNIPEIAGGTAIVTASRLLAQKLASMGLPIPTTGVMKYLVQLASGFGLSYVVKNILKQRGMAQKGMELVVAMIISDVINDLLLNGGSLSGLLGMGKQDVYTEIPYRVAGMKGLGAGVYTPEDTGDSSTSRFKGRMGHSLQLAGFGG